LLVLLALLLSPVLMGADRFQSSLTDPFESILILADIDGDGVPDESDCRPTDGSVWRPPAPARNLRIDGTDPSIFTWDEPEDPGCVTPHYDVVMSGVPGDWSNCSCVEESTTATTATDFNLPSPGETIFYLVRSRNTCGEHLGFDSDLNPRTGQGCTPLPKALGEPCTMHTECQSGFCVGEVAGGDSVCCESPCDGLCESCQLELYEGLCEPIPDNEDPYDECPGERCIGSGIHPAETCNGARECESDQGPSYCDPYMCVPDPQSCAPEDPPCCLSGCTNDGHCAPGFGCDPSGYCLGENGTTCNADDECLSNACCGGYCRDLANDDLHCGSCFAECVEYHASNDCWGGACHAVCHAGWGNCDGDHWNGCEQSLGHPDHCGECGLVCDDPPHGIAGCQYIHGLGGECIIASCVTGWADCDTYVSNGCEIGNGPARNSRIDPIWVGEKCGDYRRGFPCHDTVWEHMATINDQGSVWFEAKARECSACLANIGFRVTLTPPPGSDFNVYVEDYWGVPLGHSENPGDAVDQVIYWSDGDLGSYNYYVKVVWVSGPPCATFTLRFDGRSD